VIVVVEGPSAAGKTTWVAAHGGPSALLEELPADDAPDEAAAAAQFWVERAVRRWARAVELERRTGLAVCDTDPFKLHYAWSMWQIGAGSRDEFEAQIEATEGAFASRRLGFADRYLVSIPDVATLAHRRAGDQTRRRRQFDVHARLGEPLRRWYRALEHVRPGSVRWELAAAELGSKAAREDRYRIADVAALIDLVTHPT
jgi:hypothetical protein